MKKQLIFIAIPLVLASIIGVRLAEHNARPANPSQATNTTNLRHLTIKIYEMCPSCPDDVENALKDTPGVINATVGFVGKGNIAKGKGGVEGRGEVVYDAAKTNPEKIIQTILPYEGAILSDEATQTTELTPLSRTFWIIVN
jgi:copper chaperone CopZ